MDSKSLLILIFGALFIAFNLFTGNWQETDFSKLLFLAAIAVWVISVVLSLYAARQDKSRGKKRR